MPQSVINITLLKLMYLYTETFEVLRQPAVYLNSYFQNLNSRLLSLN